MDWALFGNAIFNSTITASFPYRRGVAALAVAMAIPFAGMLTPLALMIWILVPFIALAISDTLDTPGAERRELVDDDFEIE